MYKQKFDDQAILKSLKYLNAVHSDPYRTIIRDYQKLCKEISKKGQELNQENNRNTMSVRGGITQNYNIDNLTDLNTSQIENNSASQTLLNTIMDQRDKIKSLEKEVEKYIEEISKLRNKVKVLEETEVSLEKLVEEMNTRYHEANELKEKKATEVLKYQQDYDELIMRFTVEKQKMAEEWNKLLTEQETWNQKEKDFYEKEKKLNEALAQLKHSNAKKNLVGRNSEDFGYNLDNAPRKTSKNDDFKVIDREFVYRYQHKLHQKSIINMTQDMKAEVISTCSNDGYVKVFNTVSCKEQSSIYCGNNLPISMDFSSSMPDNFLTGHNSNMVQIWSLRSERSKMSFTNHSDAVNTVKFFDNSKCWSGSSDRTLKLMDLKKGSVINTYMCISGCFSSATDGCYAIYTGHNDGKLKVWTENKKSVVLEDKIHDSKITDIQFSSDGNTIITFAKGESICFWDIRMTKTRYQLNLSNLNLPGGQCTISVDKDSRRLFCGGLNGEATIYDISNETLKKITSFEAGKHHIHHTIYSDVSENIYFANSNGELICYCASRN